MKTKIHFTSQRQNWKTPSKFFEELNKEFDFDFDPCPTIPKFDGLVCEWGKVNFINPPYNQCKLWLEKGFKEFRKGKTCVFLIPSRTDTKFWHEFCMRATEIRFIKGRLKFDEYKNSAPFPSALVIFKARGKGKPK